jgi:leukotriene-A4 hydrolase
MKQFFPVLSLIALLAAACSPSEEADPSKPSTMRDPHSFAHADEVTVSHLNWTADIQFDNKVIAATATWTLERQSDSDSVIFDIRGLDIQSVVDETGVALPFSIGDTVPGRPYLGQPLTVKLQPATAKVTINYITAPDAGALQWLTKEQTRDKQHPFLFTQSQAILARTWLPCQDGPGVRFTYNATVTVPEGMLALMSAANPKEKNATGTYSFVMDQPVPSYLMALTAGDIAFKEIGRNTGVYAEPSYLDSCAWELADMQDMLDKAEALYGTYAWGQYDVIVLPPSFPFGGMENPRLTFATPTIIAGDRSLTALVAHELAHSWSGNLVTNANWNDFWLNEGFTVYFENRIMEAVYGKEYADMLQVLEYNDLSATVEEFGVQSPDTHLKLHLNDRDPDDGMSDIAYNKGAYFLRLLENTAGREKWDAFLKEYFTANAFKVMDTETFIDYLNEKLIQPNKDAFAQVDINAWIYGPGIPDNCPQVVSMRFEKVDSALAAFNNGAPANTLATAEWSTHEWLRFLKNIPADISLSRMEELDKAFQFTGTGNCEVADVWYELSIKRAYTPAYPAIENFLCSVGRRKFLTSLYGAMVATEEGKAMAMEIYKKARPTYHYVAVSTLDAMLGWPAQ